MNFWTKLEKDQGQQRKKLQILAQKSPLVTKASPRNGSGLDPEDPDRFIPGIWGTKIRAVPGISFFSNSLTVCKQIWDGERAGKRDFGKAKPCGLSGNSLELGSFPEHYEGSNYLEFKQNKQKKIQELERILIFQNFCLFYSQERINISLGCPFCLLPENIFLGGIKNSSAVALIPCSNPKPWERHQFSKALEGGAQSRGSGTAS